jgi:hypothetical protein
MKLTNIGNQVVKSFQQTLVRVLKTPLAGAEKTFTS